MLAKYQNLKTLLAHTTFESFNGGFNATLDFTLLIQFRRSSEFSLVCLFD